jgi:DnaK suppressor protein
MLTCHRATIDFGGTGMDDETARALLQAERARVQALLDEARAAALADRAAAVEEGDMTDPAPAFVSEQVDDAVVAALEERLEAIARAEQRLAAGTYGKSVLSGLPIPDERLRADPAAELTVEEAQSLR